MNTISNTDWMRSLKHHRANPSTLPQRISMIIEDQLDARTKPNSNLMTPINDDVMLVRNLLLEIIRACTNNHDHLEVEAYTPIDRTLILVVKSEQGDFKKLIGTSGTSYRALETIMAAIGRALNINVSINARAPRVTVAERDRSRKYDEGDTFDAEHWADLLKAILSTITGTEETVEVSNAPATTIFSVRLSVPIGIDIQYALTTIIGNWGSRALRKFHVQFS
jgi:predicted RNA-binding protein YlqC (UPF0109 family)